MPRRKGSTYPNRTDLNGPTREPITTVPGQPYGDAASQRRAQRVIPIGSPPGPLVPVAPHPTRPVVQPGQLPFLEPTQRPNEPVTAGLPTGPGPGPEAIGAPVLPSHPVTQMLDQIASSSNATHAVSTLADSARLLGL